MSNVLKCRKILLNGCGAVAFIFFIVINKTGSRGHFSAEKRIKEATNQTIEATRNYIIKMIASYGPLLIHSFAVSQRVRSQLYELN